MKNVLLVGITLFSLNGCLYNSQELLEASSGIIQEDRTLVEGTVLGATVGASIANTIKTDKKYKKLKTYGGSAIGAIAGYEAGKVVVDKTQNYATRENNLAHEERKYNNRTNEIKNSIANKNTNSISNRNYNAPKVESGKYSDKFMDR